jgi:Zn-finger protein
MSELAHPGDFCPNSECDDYGKLQSEDQTNIIKFGKTKAGRQRYKCKTCNWIRAAGQHAESLEEVLLVEHKIKRGQLDGLWAYVRNKGEKRATLKPKRVVSSGDLL